MLKYKKIIRSVISYVPIMKLLLRKRGTGPVNGQYYYNIYTSHVQLLENLGFHKGGTIAEFGPGDTLGVGICAILDGFKFYYAFDKIKYAAYNKNVKVLEEILNYYVVDENSINKLKNDLLYEKDMFIKYIPNWDKSNILQKDSVDLIISNAVMEHIIDINRVYSLMYNWLKPGGWCSHVIDFSAHEFSDVWYEHLYLNKIFWKFLLHGRMYPINRYSYSYHIIILKSIGYEIIHEEKRIRKKANKHEISSEIKRFYNEEDLSIATAHIILKKPNQ